MKKINIVTFQNALNYGAALQTYALNKFLCEKYPDYVIKDIDYRNKRISNSYKLITPIRKNVIKWFFLVLNDIKNFSKNYKRMKSFKNFLNNNINFTSPYKSEKYLKNNYPDSDILITGSDQVWSTTIVGELSDIYTLNFGDKNTKRISYAASVGNANIILENKEDFKNKLSRLDFISVREEDAKEQLQKISNKHIEVVLDPTLLLKKDDWEHLLGNISSYGEKYILAYVVQPDLEYIKIVNDLSEKTGLKVIHFEKTNPGYNNVIKSAYTEGPLEFVNYIKNAEYVVATSFHATVFSIIYNKNFFIVPNKKTGARVINLLDKVGIKGRTFHDFNEFRNIDFNLKNDWNKVNNKLEDERKKSINWLVNAIDEKGEENE